MIGGVAAERAAHVLIVDDDAQNRVLLEIMLSQEGLVLATASSGEGALAMVARQPPDLILLDLMMPGMDGYQITTKLKGDPATKNIPIIVITALDDRGARLRGLSAGAEDFLIKPIDRAELCVRVRNLLRLKAYGDFHDQHAQKLEDEIGSRTADLVESERLYRSTFDAAPVGIVHVGLDGRWLRVNQRICDLLGYSRDELQHGAAQQDVEPEADPAEQASLRAMALGTLDRHVIDEKRYRRRDGSFVWARVNMSVHRGADGGTQHFILVIEDITERMALEARLRHTSKMDAVGQLASGLAHDFNNLMSVVISYSEMLAEDLKANDPTRAELDEILGAGWRAVELIQQLLAFSRQQVLQPRIVDMTQVLTGMEKMLRRILGEDIELTTTFAATLGNVLVDPGQLEQVIVNLAVNARDAMPRGGKLTIETHEVELDESYTAEHAGMKPGPHVTLVVSDTGSGMDKATQARMFEPFFTTKAVGKGTGLGLSTVFGIVRQSGGAISVQSELGAGTRFQVHFPRTGGTAVARVVAPRADRRAFHGCETILLVEDEACVRTLARTILHKYGYNVLEAQSGGDALLLCEQHPERIDLLLTDVVMPRMSGRQLAERLLLVRPDMQVLYMSGYMDDAVVRHGILASTIEFIQKPITPESLALKVHEMLGAAQPRPLTHAS